MTLWKPNFWRYLAHFGSFITGLFTGFIVALLIYVFFSIKNFNKRSKIHKSQYEITDDEINQLIKKTQEEFKNNMNKKKDEFMIILYQSVLKLIYETSHKFYPNSPFPYLEITLDESLTFMKYLQQRIEELFENKMVRLFKKMTLRRIFTLKQKLVDKKYIYKYKKTNKAISFVTGSLNLINPFHWTQKIFFNKFYKSIFEKIGCEILFILGEEVYKVYSKTIFTSEKDLEDCLKELQEAVQNQEKEEKK
jgi:hypothetical protein